MATCKYTELIDSSECVGDSLVKINNNFANLDGGLCTANDNVNILDNNINSFIGGVATLAGVRLSLDPTTPTPTTDRVGVNANTLYIHPFRGNIITLWSTASNKWLPYTVSSVLGFPINCPSANTNYDIYLFNTNGIFNVEFVPWSTGSSPGTTVPTRIYKGGIAVKSLSEPNKRLMGCLRTVAANQSEQSFGKNAVGGANCKQFLWNAYNQIPVTCYSFESGTYYRSGNPWTNWVKVADSFNHRFSFITGENSLINMISQIYSSYYANLTQIVSYTGIGINSDVGPTTGVGSQIISELRGSDMTPRAQLLKSFPGSYNYLQMFENILTGKGTTVIMNEGHTNQTGYLVSLFN